MVKSSNAQYFKENFSGVRYLCSLLHEKLGFPSVSQSYFVNLPAGCTFSVVKMKLAGLKSVENAHDDSIWAAAWVAETEDRQALLLTGSLDETVRMWRSDDLEHERTSTGHCLGVVSLAAHPSGVIAASTSLDSFVRVFDVDTNATIATLEAPPSEVCQLQFNPNVSYLYLFFFMANELTETVEI